jgi:hypothetical protein
MLYAGASDRRRIDMVDNVAALDAYREGKLPLPPGYSLEYGADVLLLTVYLTVGDNLSL